MSAHGHGAGRGRRLLRGGLDVVVLPMLVGLVAGLGAAGFRWLIDAASRVLAGGLSAHPWLLVVAPVAAGLVYGPLLHVMAPGPRRQGVTEVMHAVDTEPGRLSIRGTGAAVLASAVFIAGGGSVGRAGPMVHLGGTLGAVVGRAAGLPRNRLVALVAAGAAGGFAAILGAPLAAPLLALEVIVRRVSTMNLLMTVTAAIPAWLVTRQLTGDVLIIQAPVAVPEGLRPYASFLLAGLLVGAVGGLFGRSLALVRRVCERVWRGPRWLCPAAGGVLLGAALLAVPELYGVGDQVVHDAVAGRYSAGFLFVLALGKILATSLSFGIGGTGGLFGPMLFIGATAGAEFGYLAAPDTPAMVGVCGVLGVGATLAAAARAPLTAVVLSTELAGTTAVLLPLIVVAAAATLSGRLLSRDSVFAGDPAADLNADLNADRPPTAGGS